MTTQLFVLIYATPFLVACLVAWRRRWLTVLPQGDTVNEPRLYWSVAMWITAGAVLRLPLLFDAGFHYDTGTYKAWALTLSDPSAPLDIYKEGYFADYPPLYMYVLAILGWVARFGGLVDHTAFTALIKFPALLADAAVSLLLLRELRRRFGAQSGWLLASAYWFNPAMLFDAALWGQTEPLLALLALLAWRYWRVGRLLTASAMLGAAIAFKPQGIIYAGVFGLAVLVAQPWRATLRAALAGAACFGLIVLPFAWRESPDWLFSLYLKTAGTYDYMTVNAYNLWALAGWNWQAEPGSWLGIRAQHWALLLACLTLGLIGLKCGQQLRKETDSDRRGEIMAWCFALATIAFFMLSPRMHERYILTALPFLLLTGHRAGFLLLAWTLAGLANLAYVYHHYIELESIAPADTPYVRVVSAFFVALSLLTIVLRLRTPSAPSTASAIRPSHPPRSRIPWQSRHSALAVGLTLAALLIGLLRLGAQDYPQTGVRAERYMVELTFDRPTTVATLVVFAGEGSGELLLEGLDGESWRTLIDRKPLEGFYSRHELRVSSALETTTYRLTLSGANWRINEIGLFDASGERLQVSDLHSPDLHAPILARLTDEPAVFDHPAGHLVQPYFDEIYHGRTAYEFLNGLPVYETTHPPLGKWIIAQGIRLFGMTPLGMRSAGVLFSALLVGLLALGAWALGGRTAAIAIAGSLGLFEFSRYTVGRYATIDSFLVVFLLAAAIGLWLALSRHQGPNWRRGWQLSWPLAISGLALGAAIATKWSALFAGAGLFLFFIFSLATAWLRDGRQAGPDAARAIAGAGVAYGLLPVAIYLLSYIPFLNCLPDPPSLLSLEGLTQVAKSQWDMFDYHAKLDSTHPFSSAFWTWPLNLKPLWIFGGQSGDSRSVISILGNPLIWWGGSILVLWRAWLLVGRNHAEDGLLIGAIASLYLPWSAMGRITFIYHFYPVVPFLILLIALSLDRLADTRTSRGLRIAIPALAGGLFMWFFPTLSGWPVPMAWFESLRWLPSWWML